MNQSMFPGLLALVSMILLSAATASANPLTPVLWLDADDLDGDGLSEDAGESGQSGHVFVWANKGRGPDAVAGRHPNLVLGGMNGLPVVRFNPEGNQSDYLRIGSLKSAPTDYSAFLVISPESPQTNANEYFMDSSGGTIRSIVAWSIFGNGPAYLDGNGDWHQTTASNLFAPQVLAFNLSSTSDSSIVRNGTSLPLNDASYTPTTLDGLGFPRAGSNTANFTGDFAEFIIFDRALNQRDLRNVNAYLGEKWGLAVSGGGSAFRGFQLVSGLPEPSTWVLLIGVLVSLAFGQRLRSRGAAARR